MYAGMPAAGTFGPSDLFGLGGAGAGGTEPCIGTGVPAAGAGCGMGVAVGAECGGPAGAGVRTGGELLGAGVAIRVFLSVLSSGGDGGVTKF